LNVGLENSLSRNDPNSSAPDPFEPDGVIENLSSYRFLTRILAIEGEVSFPVPKGGFADLMARAILTARPKLGNFLEILDLLIKARIKAAIKDGDHNAVTTLLEFKSFRAKGIQPVHRHGKSFTKIDRIGPYSDLFKKIKLNIFKNPVHARKICEQEEGGLMFQQEFNLSQTDGRGRAKKSWCYRISLLSLKETITIHHASNEEVPLLIRQLTKLWDLAVTEKDTESLLKKLSEFEWWFMVANITGRCSAALGDALSLTLRLNAGHSLRKTFFHLDWEVLSRTVDEFIFWRIRDIHNLLPNSTP